MYVIDTPTNLQNHAARLKAAGVSTAFRYESGMPNAGWKRWQPDEARAFARAGLHMAIVYEDTGRGSTLQQGYDNASYALDRCEARGQPDGTAIYYAACDYDASVSDINQRIVPYFHGVNKAHAQKRPKIRIGSYGSGLANKTLKAIKLIDLSWITCSLGFQGSRAAIQSGDYDIWQHQCDTHLLGIDVDFNTAKIADYGQFLPWGQINFEEPEPPLASAVQSPEIAFQRGRGSWYSQFNGRYNWVDSGDTPGSNALGVPDDCQGVAFYNNATLGHWFEIIAPNGFQDIAQQTDIGPSPSTGREIDISAVFAERMSYSPATFPTDAIFAWRHVDAPAQVATLSPRNQAIKWKQIRQGAA